MRAAIAAAFAVGAMAVPYVKPRQDIDWVTDVQVEYATVVVTVTAGAEPADPTSSKHYGHKHWNPFSWTHRSSTAAATTEATSEAPAPTSEAPAPTTSTYEAPATSEAPAPTTSTSAAQTTVQQQPASTSTPAASSAAAAPSSAGTSYSDTAVYHHNLHRSNHSAPNIAWSDTLAATAQKIGESCYYAHNTDMDKDSIGGYGQNIAAGVTGDKIDVIITDMFYNGEVGWYDGLYGQAQPDMTNFEHWGHFSQIVWKATTHVGCATVDCSSQGLGGVSSGVSPYFTVCNYQSPGNYQNEYGDNVGTPLDRATVTAE